MFLGGYGSTLPLNNTWESDACDSNMVTQTQLNNTWGCDSNMVTVTQTIATHANVPSIFSLEPNSQLNAPLYDNAPSLATHNDAPPHFLISSESPAQLSTPATPFTVTNCDAQQAALSVSAAGAAPSSESNTLAAPRGFAHTTPTPVSNAPAPPLTNTSQVLAQSANENRRSGRPLVPSKRVDQMNMIGSEKASSISSIGKSENVPPGQRPDWVDIVKKHLQECDLGHEWTTCVEGWLVLEEQLGFGTLPGSKVSSFSRRHFTG